MLKFILKLFFLFIFKVDICLDDINKNNIENFIFSNKEDLDISILLEYYVFLKNQNLSLDIFFFNKVNNISKESLKKMCERYYNNKFLNDKDIINDFDLRWFLKLFYNFYKKAVFPIYFFVFLTESPIKNSIGVFLSFMFIDILYKLLYKEQIDIV
jgi:hypothetical protein